MECAGHFDSIIGVLMACTELADAGRIEEVLSEEDSTTVYRFADDTEV